MTVYSTFYADDRVDDDLAGIEEDYRASQTMWSALTVSSTCGRNSLKCKARDEWMTGIASSWAAGDDIISNVYFKYWLY